MRLTRQVLTEKTVLLYLYDTPYAVSDDTWEKIYLKIKNSNTSGEDLYKQIASVIFSPIYGSTNFTTDNRHHYFYRITFNNKHIYELGKNVASRIFYDNGSNYVCPFIELKNFICLIWSEMVIQTLDLEY